MADNTARKIVDDTMPVAANDNNSKDVFADLRREAPLSEEVQDASEESKGFIFEIIGLHLMTPEQLTEWLKKKREANSNMK